MRGSPVQNGVDVAMRTLDVRVILERMVAAVAAVVGVLANRAESELGRVAVAPHDKGTGEQVAVDTPALARLPQKLHRLVLLPLYLSCG